MSTERTPFVTDEQIHDRVDEYVLPCGKEITRVVKEFRGLYEAELTRKDAEIEALREAAQDVVARWDSPKWKYDQHTGEIINRLRVAAKLEHP